MFKTSNLLGMIAGSRDVVIIFGGQGYISGVIIDYGHIFRHSLAFIRGTDSYIVGEFESRILP